MSTFEIKLSNVPARLVTPILELVEGEGVAVETVNSCGGKKPQRRKQRRSGNTGLDVALSNLSAAGGGGMTASEMQQAFRLNGMAAVSAQPRLSELVKAGKAVKDEGDERYYIKNWYPAKVPA